MNKVGYCKYSSYRGTLNAPTAQRTAELNADLAYAQNLLATAKATNDTRVMRLAAKYIKEAQTDLQAVQEVAK